MNYRPLGRTGWDISDISFGAWAIGGTWGPVDDVDSMRALHAAVDCGVNFIDTADVYGDGRSERLICRLKQERKEEIVVATKAGRRLNPHVASGYNEANLEAFVDRSRENLGMDALDLVQLHCPPTDAYFDPGVFQALDRLAQQGKIRHWGVSVERVEEGLKALTYENCQSVQIIFNIMRQRPAELFLAEAARRQVGVLARLPLSSGLLTGKITAATVFSEDDHRNFNREGQSFDKGETFSGIPLEVGLEAVEAIKAIAGEDVDLTQFALRWITMFDGVTAAIPGGKRPEQVRQNCAASDLAALSDDTMKRLQGLYESKLKRYAHYLW